MIESTRLPRSGEMLPGEVEKRLALLLARKGTPGDGEAATPIEADADRRGVLGHSRQHPPLNEGMDATDFVMDTVAIETHGIRLAG
jgi:hypothetical protein